MRWAEDGAVRLPHRQWRAGPVVAGRSGPARSARSRCHLQPHGRAARANRQNPGPSRPRAWRGQLQDRLRAQRQTFLRVQGKPAADGRAPESRRHGANRAPASARAMLVRARRSRGLRARRTADERGARPPGRPEERRPLFAAQCEKRQDRPRRAGPARPRGVFPRSHPRGDRARPAIGLPPGKDHRAGATRAAAGAPR